MAKIFKISGYLVDRRGEYNADDIPCYLESGSLYGHHIHAAEAEFEWDDDNHLNYYGCDLAECEKYFKSQPTPLDGRTVEVGGIYRHFKGKLVKVLAVSQDTENVGSYSVVYECMDRDNQHKIWHRPFDMFVSEVDHKKYPDAKQKWRFEKVKDL